MPRNMSFSLTTDQIRNRTKTVTRRKGWANLKPGEILNACVKCMGLKPGEKAERICQVCVTDVRREPLNQIIFEGLTGTDREGFQGLTPSSFIDMFISHMGGGPRQEVTRIEFVYIDEVSDD